MALKDLNSKDEIEKLYKKDYLFTAINDAPFEIPLKGGLSILSIGYKGLIAWRKRKLKDSDKE